MKKLIFIFAFFLTMTSTHALAQTEIGASYEIRDSNPTNGFGLRFQKGILDKIPLVNLGLRAHFSYFSEQNNATLDGLNTPDITYSRDFTNYDFGLALIGGVSVGLFEPYVGVGLGSESTDINREDIQGVSLEDENESNVYWNTLAGAKVSIIPLIKPFVEFRYSNNSLSKPTAAELYNSRVIVGISLSF